MNNLLNEIQKRLPGLSKGQQRIANFITASYEQAAFMTAAKLGETVGVSESDAGDGPGPPHLRAAGTACLRPQE